MALTEKYCNPDLATGSNDGSSEADAWQTLAAAFSGISAGDRLNVKRTASRHDPSTGQTFAVDCTEGNPIHIRGYTSTIDDGGIFQMAQSLSLTGDHVILEGFDIEAGLVTQALNVTGDGAYVHRCRAVNTNAAGEAAIMTDASCSCCYFKAGGSSATEALRMFRGHALNCFIDGNGATGVHMNSTSRANNLVGCCIVNNGSALGVYLENSAYTSGNILVGNRIYNTGNAISFLAETPSIAQAANIVIAQNVIYTCTNGVYTTDTEECTVQFYANAIGNASGSAYNGFGDQPTFGITLSADPYDSAATGDLSLNDTAGGGALCRDAGFAIEMMYDWTNMTEQAVHEGAPAGGGGCPVMGGTVIS
jgi:hypothetical protein